MAMLDYSAQLKYGTVFDILMPNYASVAASFSPFQHSSYSGGYAEYAVNQTIDGVNYLYFIYFLPDAYGVWRLNTM
jgi:hypothetical protein